MLYDYEDLKRQWDEHGADEYVPRTSRFLDLPARVELSCYVCGTIFFRDRYRLISRFRSGIEHAFCHKGCASRWVREQEYLGKLNDVFDCSYQDFVNHVLPRRDDLAYVKRPLYRVPCENPNCLETRVHSWDVWMAMTKKPSMVNFYCSYDCQGTERKFRNTRDETQLGLNRRTLLNKNYRSYQAGASRRQLEWALTLDQFEQLIFSNCVYCGREPEPRNGVDRVDNKLGYVFDNCASSCSECNARKLVVSKDEFLSHSFKTTLHQLRLRFTEGSCLLSDSEVDGFLQEFQALTQACEFSSQTSS